MQIAAIDGYHPDTGNSLHIFELAVQLYAQHMPALPPDAVLEGVLQITQVIRIEPELGNKCLLPIFKSVIRLYNNRIQGEISIESALAAVIRIADITHVRLNPQHMFNFAIQLYGRHLPPEATIPPDAVAAAIMQIVREIAVRVGLPPDLGNPLHIFELAVQLYEQHMPALPTDAGEAANTAAAAIMQIVRVIADRLELPPDLGNPLHIFELAVQLYGRHMPVSTIVTPEAAATAVRQIAGRVGLSLGKSAAIEATNRILENCVQDCTADETTFRDTVLARDFLFRPALNSKNTPIEFNGTPVTILLIRDFLSFAYHKDLKVLADSISCIDVFEGRIDSNELKQLQTAKLEYPHKRPAVSLIQAAYAVPYGQNHDLDTVLKRTDEFVLRFNPSNVLSRLSAYNRRELFGHGSTAVYLLVFDQKWDAPKMSHMFRHHVKAPRFALELHESYFEFPYSIDLGVDSQLITTSLLISESIVDFEPKDMTSKLSFSGNPFDGKKGFAYCIIDEQLTSQKPLLKNKRKAVGNPFVEFQTFPLSIMKFYGR
jgi:hypothetical protein